MPGLSFNPYCGACGGLNSRGFCGYTACIYPMSHTTALPVTVKEKKPYVQPLMEIFDIPDDVEEILIRTKEKTMRYVSDGYIAWRNRKERLKEKNKKNKNFQIALKAMQKDIEKYQERNGL